MAENALQLEIRDNIAVIQIDDGKANALSPSLIESLHTELDRASKETGAVLLVGRPGRFSAGFDLSVMRSGPDAVRTLVTAGAELLLRLFEFEKPVVVACTGHALAAGALILLSADARIGVDGNFKIGLNEVAIGMTLPIFGMELARNRISKLELLKATSQAKLYAPREAVVAGYLDQVTSAEELEATALAEAQRLSELAQPAFRHTRDALRGPTVAVIRETLETDMARLTGLSS